MLAFAEQLKAPPQHGGGRDLAGVQQRAVGGIDLHASWRAANSGSATDLRPVSRPDASGIDSGKAQRLLGWQATRTWRDYLTDSGEPR